LTSRLPLSLHNLEAGTALHGVMVDHATVQCGALQMLPVMASVSRRRQVFSPVGLTSTKSPPPSLSL
jgi:transposase-like protein